MKAPMRLRLPLYTAEKAAKQTEKKKPDTSPSSATRQTSRVAGSKNRRSREVDLVVCVCETSAPNGALSGTEAAQAVAKAIAQQDKHEKKKKTAWNASVLWPQSAHVVTPTRVAPSRVRRRVRTLQK